MINMARTVMVAGLLKPEIASSGVTPNTGPRTKIRPMIAKATKSMGKRSRAKTTRVPIRMTKARAISGVKIFSSHG